MEVDVDNLVEQAYRDAWGRSVFERAWRRTFNQPLDIQVGLAYSMDSDALRARMEEVAGEIHQEPRSASLSFDNTTGKLTYRHSVEGRVMDVDASMAVVEEAMLNPEDKTAEAAVNITQPSLSDENVNAVLVVDIMGNTLKLYNKDTLINTYNVATGAPKYPTPLGKFYIDRKEHDPVWVNPGSEWAKTMPPTIPAGPEQPPGSAGPGHHRGRGDGADPRARSPDPRALLARLHPHGQLGRGGPLRPGGSGYAAVHLDLQAGAPAARRDPRSGARRPHPGPIAPISNWGQPRKHLIFGFHMPASLLWPREVICLISMKWIKEGTCAY